MRIDNIELSWFRGAAESVKLELGCKSKVVYGSNGSGKSAFVDAIEYALNEGKIGHLTHEYSGRRQEKAIPNTHTPENCESQLVIALQDGTKVFGQIDKEGRSSITGDGIQAVAGWDYRRTILRQDEVARFIHDTKGSKYSALLPLLGLGQMEIAAENLRQLQRSLEEAAKLKSFESILKSLARTREEAFGQLDDGTILTHLQSMYKRYCPNETVPSDLVSICDSLDTELEALLSRFTDDQKIHMILQNVAERDFTGDIETIRATGLKLANALDPLITEKLEVLKSASVFACKVEDAQSVKCPACGRLISILELRDHIANEHDQLSVVIDAFDKRKLALGKMCDMIRSLKEDLEREVMTPWKDSQLSNGYSQHFNYLDTIDIEVFRSSCGEPELKEIEKNLQPLVSLGKIATREPLPAVKQLNEDKKMVETAKAITACAGLSSNVKKVKELLSFVEGLEGSIRSEIRSRSREVIESISADIESMWSFLHPDEEVEDVRLYVPEESDKAIDIGLKFYGVEQDSPRLTLSEGHRNSLGLCIFLAMAKCDLEFDRPLFLDDVIVSLDRGHRGMVAALLEREFHDRQVVILTHDRDWYTELRLQLDQKQWSFGALLPFETPRIGIRWSHKTTTFDDARTQIESRPDSAGNDARKIMDVELALIAERLFLRLPYLRGDKNDKRMAHDFLERIVSDGKGAYQMKKDGIYVPFVEAIGVFSETDRLLLSWGNRASHNFDLVKPEAVKLIDICEKTLQLFKCVDCGKNVWHADADFSEWLECQCGNLRWKYGKI